MHVLLLAELLKGFTPNRTGKYAAPAASREVRQVSDRARRAQKRRDDLDGGIAYDHDRGANGNNA